MRQQRRERGPVRRLLWVFGEGSLDHGDGRQPPGLTQRFGHLVGGDLPHQPVHRYRPLPSRADQRIPAQRRDRVPGGHLVVQQRAQHRHHLGGELAGQPRAWPQEQPQRDRFGGAERQQPQQPRRPRCGLFQLGER